MTGARGAFQRCDPYVASPYGRVPWTVRVAARGGSDAVAASVVLPGNTRPVPVGCRTRRCGSAGWAVPVSKQVIGVRCDAPGLLPT